MKESVEAREVLGRLWQWMSEHRGLARLFFESYSRSLGGGEPWATFAVDSVRDWQSPLRRILTAPGAEPPTEAEVTLALAVLRGLLALDPAEATGEVDRVDLAWRRYVELNLGY